VRTLTYAIDYEFWGLDAGGFKFTNGLIHLVNVYLVLWLALRLFRRPATGDKSYGTPWDVPLAALAAAIFGVHPAVVEPVIWVPGREELLMALGALGCLHFHMTARRLGEDGDKPRTALVCYACAAFSCAAACLSNAVAAAIPALIVAWDVLMLDRPKLRRILYGTSMLWVIGVATIAIKKFGPEYNPVAGRGEKLLETFCAERLMVILNVYWLNLKTLFWPRSLGLAYDMCRPQSFLNAEVVLGALALGLTCALMWKLRRRKSMLFGLLWFGLALGPTSQIMPHHIDRADRFLYLPLVGLTVSLAMGLKPLCEKGVRYLLPERPGGCCAQKVPDTFLTSRLSRWAAIVGTGAVGVSGLFLLVVLSAYQVQTWQDGLSVWNNAIKVDPNNIFAHRSFAGNLTKTVGLDRAVSYYQSAIELDPDNVETLDALACLLGTYDEIERRDYPEACRLSERACQLTEWNDLRFLKAYAIIHCNSAEHLVARGEFQQAIEQYDKVLGVFPDDEVAVFNLAWLLATCPDERLRNPARAIQLAEPHRQLTGRVKLLRLHVLTAAYSEAGRHDAAVAAIKDAIQQAQAIGNAASVEELRSKLKRYQNGAAGFDTR
jgi:tetratricopeptide (TPR) repeat protein